MSIPSWSRQTKQMAREKGLHLVKYLVQGRYAKEGPMKGGSIGAAGTATPDEARVLMLLVQLTGMGEDGIRNLPRDVKDASARALRIMLAIVEGDSSDVQLAKHLESAVGLLLDEEILTEADLRDDRALIERVRRASPYVLDPEDGIETPEEK